MFIHSTLEITLSFSPLPYAKRLRFAEHINIHTVSAHVTETPFFAFHSMYMVYFLNLKSGALFWWSHFKTQVLPQFLPMIFCLFLFINNNNTANKIVWILFKEMENKLLENCSSWSVIKESKNTGCAVKICE